MDAASEFEMVFQSAFAPLALAEIPPLARLVSSELVELGRRLLEAHFGALTVPAMPVEHLLHFAVRKRFFEEQARAGLTGVAHVVSLGAGWDPLLLALARAHPELAFTELDRPEVSEPKRSALVKAGLLLRWTEPRGLLWGLNQRELSASSLGNGRGPMVASVYDQASDNGTSRAEQRTSSVARAA